MSITKEMLMSFYRAYVPKLEKLNMHAVNVEESLMRPYFWHVFVVMFYHLNIDSLHTTSSESKTCKLSTVYPKFCHGLSNTKF